MGGDAPRTVFGEEGSARFEQPTPSRFGSR
jgi:hypothetical protein